jgi:hypothetical protein
MKNATSQKKIDHSQPGRNCYSERERKTPDDERASLRGR